ncbi:hypothetical protein ACI6Q2_03385 [Chitinophagaceae bacterium LWZ2-11]
MAKKSFVLRIDENMYTALEKWAADEFRSVNGQLEWLVDKALKDAGREKPPPEKGSQKNNNNKK